MENLVRVESFENQKRFKQREIRIRERDQEKIGRYKSEIKKYKEYCIETSQAENTESVLDFLYTSIETERVKKTTWEKRLSALIKYFSYELKVDLKFDEGMNRSLANIRDLYNDEMNSNLIKVEGKRAVNKETFFYKVEKLKTREKAICMVNMITANRPNEMVRLKIGHFDLENNSVGVYMKKQKTWHNKRLTPEVVSLVESYIKEYDLKNEDYFVGRVFKNGRYESRQVSEEGYRKLLQRTIGYTAYNLRKTQVSSMYEKGADLPDIAKQTGHKSTDTITKHYLHVSDKTIDKYL